MCSIKRHYKVKILFGITMIRRRFERIPEEQPTTDALLKFFNDPDIKDEAMRVSPRLSECVHLLKDAYMCAAEEDEGVSQMMERIDGCLSILNYKRYPGPSPICRSSFKKHRYYKCFDCGIGPETCICQKCFEGNHIGHTFRVYEAECYCDCGNSNILKKQSFCSVHRDFKPPPAIPKDQKASFIKEMSFMVYFSIRMSTSGVALGQGIKNLPLFCTLKLIILYIEKSYTYQLLVSDLLMRNFDEQYKKQPKSILVHILDTKWESAIYTKLSAIYLELVPIDKMRQQIMAQLWNRLTHQDSDIIKSVDKANVDSQILIDGTNVLKLLESGRIQPLIINIDFESQSEENYRFLKILDYYGYLSKWKEYPQIIRYTIRNANLSMFWNFNKTGQPGRYLQKCRRSYKRWFIDVVKAVRKLDDRSELLAKMARQSFAPIAANQNTYLKAEQSFAFSTLAYLDYDSEKIYEMDEKQIKEFLGIEKEGEQLISALEKTIGEEFYIITQELDDGEVVRNKTCLYYACYKLIATFCVRLQQLNPHTPLFLTRSLEAHWNKINNQIQKCEEYFAQAAPQEEEDENEQLYDTEGKLNMFLQKLCGMYNNFLCLAETNLHEIIISNELDQPLKQGTKRVYRQLLVMFKDLKKDEFKDMSERWIDNDVLLKQFINENFEEKLRVEMEEQEEGYYTNLNVDSEYVPFKICPEVIERFKKKLNTTTSTRLSTTIFRSNNIDQILKPLKAFMDYTKNHPFEERKSKDYMRGSINLIIISMIMLYLQTKEQDYSKFLLGLPLDWLQEKELITDYNKELVRLFKEQIGQASLKDSRSQRLGKLSKLRRAKSLRNKKMKELRDKQSVFLAEHVEQIESEESEEEQKDECIHCKQSHNDSPLNTLCHVKFSDLLSHNMLGVSSPFLLVTGCLHRIHKQCEREYLSTLDTYNHEFECFLCKKTSAIRLPDPKTLPEGLRDQAVKEFTEELSAIVAVFKTDHEIYQDKVPDVTSDNIVPMLFKSLVYSIYLYFFTHPTLFLNSHMHSVRGIINFLKYLVKMTGTSRGQLLKAFEYGISQDETLRNTIKMALHLVSPQQGQDLSFLQAKEDQSYYENEETYSQKQELCALYSILIDKQEPLIPKKKLRIERASFYKLPEDLTDLNKEVGECYNCQVANSRLKICLFCGVKICSKCNKFMEHHIQQAHFGCNGMIDVQLGKLHFRKGDSNEQTDAIYGNYVTERWNNALELPEKNEFLLDHKMWEEWLLEILMERTTVWQEKEQRGGGNAFRFFQFG